jgi:hypothetical protein
MSGAIAGLTLGAATGLILVEILQNKDSIRFAQLLATGMRYAARWWFERMSSI